MRSHLEHEGQNRVESWVKRRTKHSEEREITETRAARECGRWKLSWERIWQKLLKAKNEESPL